MSRAARKTFKAFHARDPEPVYPFDAEPNPEFDIDVQFPDFVCVGRAVRVLYDSDKWNEVGDVVGYYHTHGPDDGDLVFSGGNKVQLYAPKPYFQNFTMCKFPVKWPDEIVPLGGCSGWVAEPKNSKDGKLFEGKCKNAVLYCSPYGWVSRREPLRVFLAVIELDTGVVEAIINGPGLIVTPDGIEG